MMRYEDMKLNPLLTFTAEVRFAGLPDDPARIQKALVKLFQFFSAATARTRKGF
jgi:hypothetical protein